MKSEYTGRSVMANAKKLPSGNWRVQLYIGEENGKRKMKSFTARTKWEAEREAEEYSGEKEKLTVREAIGGYISLKSNVLSRATILNYRSMSKTCLQSIMGLDVNEVTSLSMQRAVNEDAERIGRSRILGAINLVKASLKIYGIKSDIEVTLPPKIPKIKELPTPKEIIDIVKGTEIELPVLLALWLSLRISEVRGLQFRDIRGNVITIRRSKICVSDGRTEDYIKEYNKTYNSTRKIAIPQYIKDLIDRIPYREETEYIVPDSYYFITQRFKQLTRQHGITMTFHDLRHLNASVMVKLGIPDKYAMERGGWSTPSVLRTVYQHTFSEDRQIVDNKIDDYFNALISHESSHET